MLTELEHRADIEAETARVALLDADLLTAAREEGRREALTEAVEAIDGSRIVDGSYDREDGAYEEGLTEAQTVIFALRDKKGAEG